MPNARIVITFNSDASNGDVISFEGLNTETLAFHSFSETFQNPPRSASGQIEIAPPTGNVGERSAQQFAVHFDLDYNGFNAFTISQSLNVVTIDHNSPIHDFQNFVGSGIATAVITNTSSNPMVLDEVLFLASAVDICTQYRVSLESTPVIDYIERIQQNTDTVLETINNAGGDNPFIIELSRYSFAFLRIYNSTGIYVDYQTYMPPMIQELLTVNVLSGIGGATVIVNPFVLLPNDISPNPEIEFEYSLNDVDWQTSNTFTGQANGDYTVYVRDQFGCKIQKDYTVDNIGTLDAFLYVSEANSLSLVEQQTIDYEDVHPNDLNRFSCQQLNGIKYGGEVIFKDTDLITIQFKSNFDTHVAKLRHENGTQDDLPVVKKSNNLGRFLALGCITYVYDTGLIGIYFTTGNIYDNLGVITGAHELNGNIPYFAKIGQQVEVVGLGFKEIVDIVLDEDNNRKVIIIEDNATGGLGNGIIRSYYNLLPYEIYEFTVDFNAVNAGLYDVLLTCTSANYDDVNYVSENIIVKEDVSDCLHIIYYNDNNRDIFYSYGIEHLIRVPYQNVYMELTDESDNNITDLTVQQISSRLKDGNKIEFDELTRNQALKVAIAISCKKLFINGIGYVKNGKPRIEEIDNTNLFRVVVSLIKTNINYTSNRQGQINTDSDLSEVLVPQLLVDNEYLIF